MTNKYYEVTRGIALPNPGKCEPTEEGKKLRAALRLCTIHDSFLVPDISHARIASIVARRIGLRAAYRKQPDGTYRIFRTE